MPAAMLEPLHPVQIEGFKRMSPAQKFQMARSPLAPFLEPLERLGLPYCVTGSVAASVYGEGAASWLVAP